MDEHKPLAALTPDELSRHYTSEMQRVEGSDSHYSCWYDRGWFRTSKGNAYRRPAIERFVERLATKPDFDGTNPDEDASRSSFAI
jgi:hypothetical protein